MAKNANNAAKQRKKRKPRSYQYKARSLVITPLGHSILAQVAAGTYQHATARTIRAGGHFRRINGKRRFVHAPR